MNYHDRFFKVKYCEIYAIIANQGLRSNWKGFLLRSPERTCLTDLYERLNHFPGIFPAARDPVRIETLFEKIT